MQSGFNTNVRYRSVIFHVQTEDSGRAHPHVITHLYHGGTILASMKRDYGDLLDSPELARELKELMEIQHAGMLQQLRRGEFDAVIRERLGPDVLAETPPVAPTRASSEAENAPEAAPARADRPAQRPLDEMILAYLVENARQRKRRVQ